MREAALHFSFTSSPDIRTAARIGGAGQKAGRVDAQTIDQFDEAFYLRAYQMAADEIRLGLAASARDHYLKHGRARGYLPYATAPRPDDAAAMTSRFGGFWTDAPDALDRIQGRLDMSAITFVEAEWLRQWVRDGYAILPSAIPDTLLTRAARSLDGAYRGEFPDLRFECHAVEQNGVIPWREEINPHASKAIDIHVHSIAIRDLILSGPVVRFLALVFEAMPLVSQTLGFLRGSSQPAHQDSAYVAYSIARRFAATWIALEDVTADAGELFYYPGSNRFDDYLYQGEYKSVAEANRLGGLTPEQTHAQIGGHERILPAKAAQHGLSKQVFRAKRGDVLVWNSDLAHGGMPISREATRKSIVTHYCPRFNVPLFAEHFHQKPRPHGQGYYTSGAYKL